MNIYEHSFLFFSAFIETQFIKPFIPHREKLTKANKSNQFKEALSVIDEYLRKRELGIVSIEISFLNLIVYVRVCYLTGLFNEMLIFIEDIMSSLYLADCSPCGMLCSTVLAFCLALLKYAVLLALESRLFLFWM